MLPTCYHAPCQMTFFSQSKGVTRGNLYAIPRDSKHAKNSVSCKGLSGMAKLTWGYYYLLRFTVNWLEEDFSMLIPSNTQCDSPFMLSLEISGVNMQQSPNMQWSILNIVLESVQIQEWMYLKQCASHDEQPLWRWQDEIDSKSIIIIFQKSLSLSSLQPLWGWSWEKRVCEQDTCFWGPINGLENDVYPGIIYSEIKKVLTRWICHQVMAKPCVGCLI